MVKLFFTEVASDSSFFIEVIVENKKHKCITTGVEQAVGDWNALQTIKHV